MPIVIPSRDWGDLESPGFPTDLSTWETRCGTDGSGNISPGSRYSGRGRIFLRCISWSQAGYG